ncbi:MAG TPA: hypothetical protein DCP57_03840 [Gammaproteobacteria bacterium]|nr:hypothetical protein [Gammaproteobacteria bacterium]|tara:strand:+ start:262 stop:870 length:609 start_codon:yes stop_codon:yes gene_type:complete
MRRFAGTRGIRDAMTRRINKSEERILKAAQILYYSRGVSLTSMAEIAAKAQVSRQTIYNAFGKKLDLVKEVVLYVGEGDEEVIERLLPRCAGLEESLELLISIQAGARVWNHVVAMPFMRLACELEKHASYEIAQNAEVMRSHFESVLASRQHVLEAKGADYREVAAFLVNNAALLRAGANDADELRQMITALKEITLAALQ